MGLSFAQTPKTTQIERIFQPLNLEPSLVIRETYDDNINLTNAKDSDFITSIEPGLGLSYHGDRADLAFNYRAGIGFYAQHPDLNTTKHSGNLNGGYIVSPTLSFRLQDGFAYSPDATDINPTGIITSRTNQFENSLSATLTEKLALRTSLNLSYSNDLVRYEASNLIDSTVHGIQFGIMHETAPANTVRFNAGFRYFSFDNSITQKIYTLSIGWIHYFSDTFTLDATGGADMYQDQSQEYTPSGTFDAGLSKSWKYASVSLRAQQGLTVSGGFTSDTVLNRSVVFSWQETLTAKLRAVLSGNYATNDTVSGPSLDTTSYGGAAGFDYEFSTWLKGEARYAYFRQKASATGVTEFDRNQAWIALTATLPKRQ